MPRPHRWPTVAAVLLLTPVLYVASYPLAIRCLTRRVGHHQREVRSLALYAPVEFLIDTTPVRQPILSWCGICGAGEEVEFLAAMREVVFQSR